MGYFKRIFVLSVFFLFLDAHVFAQKLYVIPAFTGYAIPNEKSNEEDESSLFSEKDGLHNWSNRNQRIFYYFYLRNIGQLHIAMYMRNESAGNTMFLKINNQVFKFQVPQSKQFKKLDVGTINIPKSGFYNIELYATVRSGKQIANLQSIELSGPASLDMHYNLKPRRNAASVHLSYPLPDSVKAIGFYNEVTVPKNADQLYSYFMACGFARGYFGMQVNSATERRIIFSVWDAGNEAVDRNKVSDDNKVQLIGKGENVIAEGFGNEGTGGHSHFVYDWKAGETYRFYVTALPDSASGTTIYSGYFFIPETKKWKLIASFKSPKDGNYLHGLYSFLEDFWGVNGNLYRKAYYSNQWVRNQNSEWKELTQSVFTCDATGKALDRLDFGGGVENDSFYLWNGGFQGMHTKYGELFHRKGGNPQPDIDLYQNADSLVQAEKDKELILASIRAGKLDTTGSINSIYYQILKEGQGDWVKPEDSLSVRYKGTLLNGELFDESKGKPVSFPLKRLIKGWQIGLTKCREGGKIRLIIPSALAYTIRARAEKIPPNSVLVFDIDVLEIKK